MKLLLSKILPVKHNNDDFSTAITNLLKSTQLLRIATGYISTDALTEIKKIIELNGKPALNLMIGMHYFDGFTKSQYDSALYLDNFLQKKQLGRVYLSKVLKFHGKMYSFCNDSNIPFASILGSSNLTNILPINNQFETDLLLEETAIIKEINNTIEDLIKKVCIPFSEYSSPKIIENNNLLNDHDKVERVSKETLSEVYSRCKAIRFDLPLKTELKSNLNVYFGKGRQDKRGFIKPRHWYEVELIVPKKITDHPQYPKAGYPKRESVIKIYTDDGWSFNCKISGDYSKNFRSEDDLRILGKWIKGRLENYRCLKPGEMVTDEVLEKYGRNYITLISTNNPEEWILEFEPKHEKS